MKSVHCLGSVQEVERLKLGTKNVERGFREMRYQWCGTLLV